MSKALLNFASEKEFNRNNNEIQKIKTAYEKFYSNKTNDSNDDDNTHCVVYGGMFF